MEKCFFEIHEYALDSVDVTICKVQNLIILILKVRKLGLIVCVCVCVCVYIYIYPHTRVSYCPGLISVVRLSTIQSAQLVELAYKR